MKEGNIKIEENEREERWRSGGKGDGQMEGRREE